MDHEEPQLTEPYLSKQKKLMVSLTRVLVRVVSSSSSSSPLARLQAKILDHDNVNYLKKILGELAMVLDQVEAELEKRKLEYQGRWSRLEPGPASSP